MSDDLKSHLSRRGFFAGAASVLAAGASLSRAGALLPASQPTQQPKQAEIEPFRGVHQGGIITPSQKHTYFAAFDLTVTSREDLVGLLRTWTDAAELLTLGKRNAKTNESPDDPPADSGESINLSPARLTLTFGFGTSLFSKDGVDRFGLASRRPEAFVDLPTFHGDQLATDHTGGDLSVQACSDDPQVAFHAIRHLARVAYGQAQIRWVQTGFLPETPGGETPRNLMGFKDGTNNISVDDANALNQFVWVGDEGPDWMRGGSYVVMRRIRIALEHWDRMKLAFQEQTVGRRKYSGAPLGGKDEFDAVNLDAVDGDGNSVIPDNSHVRLATAASNDGMKVLRRPFSYNDGVNFTSERWPPWRQAMEFDAGLLFVCYQRDPRTGFIKIFDNMAKMDMLNQFTTHTGGGLFACPGGFGEGEHLGERLLRT